MSGRATIGFLTVGLAVAVLLYVRIGVTPVAAAFAQLRVGELAGYLVLATAIRVAYGLRWHGIARHLGAVPPATTLVTARLAGDAVGTLLPVGRLGGDPLRIGLLYRAGVDGARASAGVVMDRILEVLGNSVAASVYVCVFILTWASLTRRDGAGMLAALVLGAVGLIALMALWRLGRRPLHNVGRAVGMERRLHTARWLHALWRTEATLGRFCRDHPAAASWGLVASLLIEAVSVLEHLVLFRSFGVSLSLPTVLAVVMTSGFARVVPVPAGLGALEASQVAVLTLTSGRPDIGLVVGTLLRLHETLWIAVGLGALAAQGISPARVRLLSWAPRAST